MEALAAQHVGLAQAEARLAECAAAEQDVAAALRATQERCARESDQARTAVGEIERRIQEHMKSGQGAVDALASELASLPAEFDVTRLAAAEAAVHGGEGLRSGS